MAIKQRPKDLFVFRNKKTKNQVVVIKRIGRMMKLEYINSGLTAWYFDDDFSKRFELDPDFFQLYKK